MQAQRRFSARPTRQIAGTRVASSSSSARSVGRQQPSGGGGSRNTNELTMLVVTADDFGVNTQRTDGIVEAWLGKPQGAVSQVSLVVNGEDSARAAQLAVQWTIPMGLHFNITEGKPSSSSSPLLVGTDGLFLGKAKAFALLHTKDASLQAELTKQVQAEFVAQCCAFSALCVQGAAALAAAAPKKKKEKGEEKEDDAGQETKIVVPSTLFPTHWDGHHHVHVLPLMWAAIEAVALEGKEPAVSELRSVRLPRDVMFLHKAKKSSEDDDEGEEEETTTGGGAEGGAEAKNHSGPKSVSGEPFWIYITKCSLAIAASSPLILRQQWVSTGSFFGLDIMGAQGSKERVIQRLCVAAKASGLGLKGKKASVEIMTHIGHASKGSSSSAEFAFCHDAFSSSSERHQEMLLFRSLLPLLVSPQGTQVVGSKIRLRSFPKIVEQEVALARAKAMTSHM